MENKFTFISKEQFEVVVRDMVSSYKEFVCTKYQPRAVEIGTSQKNWNGDEVLGGALQNHNIVFFYNGFKDNIEAGVKVKKHPKSFYVAFPMMNIVVHELSHLQQEIDINRYLKDFDYCTFIEAANEAKTIELIIDNKDAVMNVINKYYPELTMDDLDQAIELFKKSVKRYGKEWTEYLKDYKPATDKQPIRMLEDSGLFLQGTLKSLYGYSNIILKCNGQSKYLVKDGHCNLNAMYKLVDTATNGYIKYLTYDIGGDAYIELVMVINSAA